MCSNAGLEFEQIVQSEIPVLSVCLCLLLFIRSLSAFHSPEPAEADGHTPAYGTTFIKGRFSSPL